MAKTLQGHSKGGTVEERRENKLYVGNLDHRVTEYHVIKLFSPYGKILSEEYMWHTHGPRRGEPRGFAFVEYSKKEEAEKAKDGLDGKLAFGRPLVVRFVDERMISSDRPPHGGHTLSTSAASSLHSSSQTSRSAKITAIRNKLRAMEQEGILGSGTSKRAKTSM